MPDQPYEGELILYQTPEGTVRIEVLYESETFWLNQKKIAELFGVDLRTVNEHLQNIFADGELHREATLRKIRRVQTEGNREVSREIEYYNLDAIISVGYRVNSAQATQFRIWATQTLREFVIKGFVLDDERLKLNKRFGKDYFDELLERIREIRASERRFYLKITDIYEQGSIDYDKTAEITTTFFKTVQNKLHWAVTGKTAAEIITERVDAAKPTMGLTTWKNAPEGKILKSDVSIAKNYLIELEIKELVLGKKVTFLPQVGFHNFKRRHLPQDQINLIKTMYGEDEFQSRCSPIPACPLKARQEPRSPDMCFRWSKCEQRCLQRWSSARVTAPNSRCK